MSSLYKRKNSPYYWWTTIYKGRKFSLSTKMTRKDLAKKIKDDWDLKLMTGELEFLGLSNHSPVDIISFIRHYLNFIEKRKSEKTYEVTVGVLRKFQEFLTARGIRNLGEINVKILNDYIDELDNAPKTKKNYLGIISLMLDQAIKEDIINNNPAKRATLPKMVHRNIHRELEPIDLKIIFDSAGFWLPYYQFLHHTGLRAGDVALLTYGNIDWERKAIVSFIRKSRQIHEFPIANCLLTFIPKKPGKHEPIFPRLYADTEKRLNHRLKGPRIHMQTMLKLNGRPKATLHSFRVTFNNTLRNLGLSIEDRQVLLAHASSETTKIYTHPNFDLATQFVNRIPVYGPGVTN